MAIRILSKTTQFIEKEIDTHPPKRNHGFVNGDSAVQGRKLDSRDGILFFLHGVYTTKNAQRW